MQYVIRLNMDEEKREKLVNYVSDAADTIIVGVAYVPIIFIVWALYQVIGQNVSIWSAFCNLVTYTSVIALMISVIDAVDKWLSLKWSDLEFADRKFALHMKVKRTVMPIVCWILIFVTFGFVLSAIQL